MEEIFTKLLVGIVSAFIGLLGLLGGGYKTLSGRINDMFKEIDDKKVEKETYLEAIKRYDEKMERFEHYFEKLFSTQEEHGKMLAEVKTQIERLEWLIKNNGKRLSN